MKQGREPEGTIASEVKSLPTEIVDELISSFELKTKPMECQARSLIIAADQKKWLFALDMGLGKTKLALDIIKVRSLIEKKKLKTLVIAPPVTLPHWVKEVGKHSDLSVIAAQGEAEKRRDLFYNSIADITLVSAQWLTRQFSLTWQNKSQEHFRKVCERFDCLIIDEAHLFSSAKSIGYKGLFEFFRHIEHLYLLTGTPVGNAHTGVWTFYSLLDDGETFGKSYQKFLEKFFSSFTIRKLGRGRHFPLVRWSPKASMKEEFRNRFWNKCIRWEETECQDLPEKSYIEIPVEFSSEQKRMYDAIEDTEDNDFQLMRITAGIECKNNPKLDTLVYVLKEICEMANKQTIVWHWLIDEGRMIEERLKKEFKIPVMAVRGETTQKETSKALAKWREKKPMILVANLESLGIGIDLYETNVCVFFSNCRKMTARRQAEKRIHRKGQLLQCNYIDLVIAGSIDETILKSIKERTKDMKDLLNDDSGNEKEIKTL